MQNIKKLLNAKAIYFIATIALLLFISCNSESEEFTNKTNTTLPNGMNLMVEKVTTETTSIGIFTHHNYGTTRKFTYNFLLREDKIKWDGGSGEPKNILFYNDTIYMRYLINKSIRTEYQDSITNTAQASYHNELTEVFQKHIDKRYFFKLFGDDYWTDISSQHYSEVKKEGNEYLIPNDNELLFRD